MKQVFTLALLSILFGVACKKETTAAASVEYAGAIVTDSATIDPPVRKSLKEEQAQQLTNGKVHRVVPTAR
jgi:hypothetical protein